MRAVVVRQEDGGVGLLHQQHLPGTDLSLGHQISALVRMIPATQSPSDPDSGGLVSLYLDVCPGAGKVGVGVRQGWRRLGPHHWPVLD